MVTLWKDIRYGARMLTKNPGFTVIAALTLALGIGASTVIFSVINAVLIRPFGAVDPEGLVIVYLTNRQGRQIYPSWADHYDFKEQATVFDWVLAWRARDVTLVNEDEPTQIRAYRVSEGFFKNLDFRAARGRTFASEEYSPGGAPVAVLSHRIWQAQFNADPKVIGRTMVLDGFNDQQVPVQYTVIGVLPRGDFQLFPTLRPDFFVPLHLQILGTLARIKPGVSQREAQAEMDVIAHRLAQQYPETNENRGARIVNAAEDLVQEIRPTFLVLLGAVGFLLLISCANVANLLLARAAAREKEIAIRTAHGAGRWRLVRQMLTESLMLAGIACIIGVAIAFASLPGLLRLIPTGVPYIGMGNIRLDMHVLGYSVLTSLFTGILFGLVSAFRVSKPNLNETLKEGGRGSAQGMRGNRFRQALVVAEVALSLVLLVGAGLMIQSFANLQAVNPGFQSDRVLTMEFFLAGNKYPPERVKPFFASLLRRLGDTPGVVVAAAASNAPMARGNFTAAFTILGRPIPAEGEEPQAIISYVSEDFFSVLGIPVQAGRAFSERDDPNSLPVAIINQAAAREHWSQEDPVGKILRMPFLGGWKERNGITTGSDLTIVGIVGDAKLSSLASDPEPEIYIPHAQTPARWASLMTRTAADPLTMTTAVKQQIWALDGKLPVRRVRSLGNIVSESVWQLRFTMTLLSVFAGVALLLGAAGIFAVLSYSVTQRRHEIGIRMAMGAQRPDVLKMVVAHGLKLACIGVAVGVPAAIGLTRGLSSWLQGLGSDTSFVQSWGPASQRGLLYGVSLYDPVTFVSISVVLLLVATAACIVPALRASNVDPLVALRLE